MLYTEGIHYYFSMTRARLSPGQRFLGDVMKDYEEGLGRRESNAMIRRLGGKKCDCGGDIISRNGQVLGKSMVLVKTFEEQGVVADCVKCHTTYRLRLVR
jgi:hypothetical protein